MSGAVTSAPTWPRRWYFRLLAAVGVPLVLVFSVEGLLRLGGYGYSTGFFLNRQIEGRAVLTDNQDFGRRFFPSGLVRYPHPFAMPAVKPSGTLRIFLLGESAAMGDPDVKFGMPRLLEVLLRERLPNRQVEVINTAMVAVNSHAILPIARDCAQHQGDLWIIYMGNNEMIGPFGSASVFGARVSAMPLVRAGLWARTTRLGQLLVAGFDSALRSKSEFTAWSGMEMMAGQKVRHDAPATARVYRHFERNLEDLLATGVRAGVPILLCTVATNLKDCAPFASLHREALTATDRGRWQAVYDAGVACQSQGNLAEAKSTYEQAAQIDGEYAELAFRRAVCCLQLGQDAQAAVLFRRARDLDALQFRADGLINEIIRRSAANFTTRSVSLVDAERLFATNSPHGSPGADYFYEHVHLTPEGNYLLAQALAEQAVKVLGLEPSGPWPSQSECLRLAGLTDWNRYEALDVIRDRMQRAPFTTQANHTQEFQRITEQLGYYRGGTKPAQVQRDLQSVSKLVDRYPADPDLRWNLAVLLESAGDLAGAEAQWRGLVSRQPQAALPCINLARVLDRLGRPAEAYPLYEEGLRINPEYSPARHALGLLCLRLDQVPEAIRNLEILVRQKPFSVEARLALSEALMRARRRSDAESQIREVLRQDPDNASAQAQLQALTTTSGGR
jgi:tetratricopeptide (TPR) repeat protein